MSPSRRHGGAKLPPNRTQPDTERPYERLDVRLGGSLAPPMKQKRTIRRTDPVHTRVPKGSNLPEIRRQEIPTRVKIVQMHGFRDGVDVARGTRQREYLRSGTGALH